jgi:phosphoglycerate kinase
MLEDNIQTNKLIIPTDVTVQKPDGSIVFKKSNEVLPDEYIGDVGPETIEYIGKIIQQSKTIVWNGPLGNYEKGYIEGTQKLAQILGNSDAKVITGGGDTETVISNIEIKKPFYFTSLAGGAMLDFLINKTLPGIEALDNIT